MIQSVQARVSQVASSSSFRILSVFVAYTALRILAWTNTPLLEDHDSIVYLRSIELVGSQGLQGLLGLSADSTPFYPVFGALFHSLVDSTEIGARLCSLFFSCVLFLAVWGIGKQIAKPLPVAIGLLVLAISPFFIRLSYSVLTEPSYIAIVYLGFCVFLSQYRRPGLFGAAIAGLLFAFAFLNRVEGILFLGVIPLFQLMHFLFDKERKYSAKLLASWIAVFALAFSILSIPQIARVSDEMGGFFLNGRQIWSVILNHPDGKSYEEKIYGLDFIKNYGM